MFPIVRFIEPLRLPTKSLHGGGPKKDIRTHMHTAAVRLQKDARVCSYVCLNYSGEVRWGREVNIKNSCIHPPCGQSMEKENITQARYDVSPQVVGKQLQRKHCVIGLTFVAMTQKLN